MFAPICRSEPDAAPALERAQGIIRGEFVAIGGRTRVARVYETGGLRLRFPNVARGCEAVMINTGGGIVGGDEAHYAFESGPHSDVTITTQAAEKIYRARSGALDDRAHVQVHLTAASGARLEWLPQETILFDGSRLSRTLDVDMSQDASLTLLESTIFGRHAMGEQTISGAFHDRWRVRRAGKLIFAEDFRLDGALSSTLERPACGGGARAVATMLLVAPDAEARLDRVRDSLEAARCDWGASAWNGFMLVRLASPAAEHVRATIVMLLCELRGRDAPRVWN